MDLEGLARGFCSQWDLFSGQVLKKGLILRVGYSCAPYLPKIALSLCSRTLRTCVFPAQSSRCP